MTLSTPQAVRILVIEDEPMIIMSIEYAIESLGHVMVGPISCLDDALEAASAGNFDCVILDVNIHGGLTYPVADILMAKELPFLLSTGYGDWSLPESLRDLRRLIKPYSEAVLAEQLSELVSRVAR